MMNYVLSESSCQSLAMQCKWLIGKTHFRNDLCSVDGDIKTYLHQPEQPRDNLTYSTTINVALDTAAAATTTTRPTKIQLSAFV